MRKIFYLLSSGLILLIIVGLNWKRNEPYFALGFLDRKLSCSDDGPLPEMTLTSMDKGMTLQADTGGQKYTLKNNSFGMLEDTYENATGQSLVFDGELKFGGFFGGHYGSCD